MNFEIPSTPQKCTIIQNDRRSNWVFIEFGYGSVIGATESENGPCITGSVRK